MAPIAHRRNEQNYIPPSTRNQSEWEPPDVVGVAAGLAVGATFLFVVLALLPAIIAARFYIRFVKYRT